jgi:DNA-binding transcriptional MerR regulator
MMTMDSYLAGEAAARSGFSLDTLRYYERVGLLPPVQRDHAGRRRYTDLDLGWLALLRCLRETGMPVADIKQFVDLTRADTDHTADRLALLEAHHRRIDHQITQLRAGQDYLHEKIQHYRQRLDGADQGV